MMGLFNLFSRFLSFLPAAIITVLLAIVVFRVAHFFWSLIHGG